MTSLANRSTMRKVPLSKPLYEFASQHPNKADFGRMMNCRPEVLDALWSGKPMMVDPWELEALRCSMLSIKSMRRSRVDKLWIASPVYNGRNSIKHAEYIREIATFVARNYTAIVQMGLRSRRRLQSWLPDQKPLYDLSGYMLRSMLPYLKRLWLENTKERELLFGGTGLDKMFSEKFKDKPS